MRFLTLDNFTFHYLQKMGCFMGGICAPNYATVFWGQMENNLHKSIYTIICELQMSIYRRLFSISERKQGKTFRFYC